MAQPGAVVRTLQQQLPVAHEDRIQIPEPAGFGTPQGAESFHFALHQVVVEGANALPAEAVAATYNALLGPNVTLAQI